MYPTTSKLRKCKCFKSPKATQLEICFVIKPIFLFDIYIVLHMNIKL